MWRVRIERHLSLQLLVRVCGIASQQTTLFYSITVHHTTTPKDEFPFVRREVNKLSNSIRWRVNTQLVQHAYECWQITSSLALVALPEHTRITHTRTSSQKAKSRRSVVIHWLTCSIKSHLPRVGESIRDVKSAYLNTRTLPQHMCYRPTIMRLHRNPSHVHFYPFSPRYAQTLPTILCWWRFFNV